MSKVLIIEDDPLWQQMIGKYATDVGAKVRTVISAGQAMDEIDKWMPDVLILDMLLAGGTGMVLLNELRTHSDLSKIPIIVCSGVEITQEQLEMFGVKATFDKAKVAPMMFRKALLEVLNDKAS